MGGYFSGMRYNRRRGGDGSTVAATEIIEMTQRFHHQQTLMMLHGIGTNNIQEVRSAVEQNAILDYDNSRPLRLAIHQNRVEIVKYLIFKGATAEFTDNITMSQECRDTITWARIIVEQDKVGMYLR